MKKVFYIQPSPYTKEIRTEKIINTICKKHKTYILSPNNGELSEYEQRDNFEILRMKKFINSKLSLLKGFRFCLNPFWINFIRKKLKKFSPDLVIIRDIYLVLAAKIAINKFDIPIIIDMAECLPGEAKLKKRNFWDYIRRNHFYLSNLEKNALNISDKTFVVTQEQVKRLSNWENKIEIVSNYFDKQTQPYFKEVTKNLPPYSFVFNGKPNNLRGLEDMIYAAKLIKDWNLPINFYIVGGSKDKITMDKLREKINDLSLENYVKMTGWVTPEEMYSYMRGATFGLIPHKNCFAVNHTMPNKIFEFMLFGKPLIVSNATPLKRIVTKHDIGYVYESGDYKALANIIRKIYNENIADNINNDKIKKIAHESYNWRNIENKILSTIKDLIE